MDHVAAEAVSRRATWVVVLVIGLIALTVGVLLMKTPQAYASSAVVSLEPRSAKAVPPAATITLVAAPYAAYAAADSTLLGVSLDSGASYADVKASVAVTMPAGSTNVNIDSTMTDPTQAADVARRIALRVVAFSRGDPTLRASLSVPATTGKLTLSSRAKPLLTTLAFVAGGCLTVLGVWMLLAQLRHRGRPGPTSGAEQAGDAAIRPGQKPHATLPGATSG